MNMHLKGDRRVLLNAPVIVLGSVTPNLSPVGSRVVSNCTRAITITDTQQQEAARAFAQTTDETV